MNNVWDEKALLTEAMLVKYCPNMYPSISLPLVQYPGIVRQLCVLYAKTCTIMCVPVRHGYWLWCSMVSLCPRAHCILQQNPPSLRLWLAAVRDTGHQMSAAATYRQISDNAQAASKEVNHAFINTGTGPSGWHPPRASAGRDNAQTVNRDHQILNVQPESVPTTSHPHNLFP
jgi:hypothetical protein